MKATSSRRPTTLPWLGALMAVFLATCGRNTPTRSVPTPLVNEATPTRSPLADTPTSDIPTATSVPLAARVNGEAIHLDEFQEELSRYAAASGVASGAELTAEEKQRVLADLIDNVLLSQAAGEAGFKPDEKTVQERIDRLAAQIGGEAALSDWMASLGYDEASFHQSMARSIASAWMRDKILADVPQVAEQVHARQILQNNGEAASEALARLNGGIDFAALAAEINPVTGGDLGWFPRGYLQDVKLEEAAFSLQPGQYSGIIQTPAGFHILQVIERDPQHLLDPDARLALEFKALQNWLEERRKGSVIEILVS